MELSYNKTSKKSFAESVASVEKAAAENGFRVLHIHDVQQTLKEKGFALPPYSIVEVCNAKFAHQVLTKDPAVGMMLPCRIAVYEAGTEVNLLLLKPGIIGDLMPQSDLGSIPREVEEILIRVVDQAAA